jgi:hypothetical protein
LTLDCAKYYHHGTSGGAIGQKLERIIEVIQ